MVQILFVRYVIWTMLFRWDVVETNKLSNPKILAANNVQRTLLLAAAKFKLLDSRLYIISFLKVISPIFFQISRFLPKF